MLALNNKLHGFLNFEKQVFQNITILRVIHQNNDIISELNLYKNNLLEYVHG